MTPPPARCPLQVYNPQGWHRRGIVILCAVMGFVSVLAVIGSFRGESSAVPPHQPLHAPTAEHAGLVAGIAAPALTACPPPALCSCAGLIVTWSSGFELFAS